MVLSQAEIPPPYGGDTLDAAVKLQMISPPPFVTVEALVRVGSFSDGLVRKYDKIQLNHQGPSYTILDGPDDDADGFLDFDGANDTNEDGFIDTHVLTLGLELHAAGTVPWPDDAPSDPVPFTIVRQPVKSAAAPLQLPAGAVIDLQWSGVGEELFSGSAVTIMFSPNGALDRIYSTNEDVAGPVVKPIFLLIGKREKVPATVGSENYRDLTNLWVTLNPQTGLVTTTEVAAADSTNSVDDLHEAREFARQAQSMGGR